MSTVDDYVRLTRTDARAQLVSILRRTWPAGRRQVDFAPSETILCFGVSFLVNHGAFGSRNIDKVPEPVPTLAKLFTRPPSSVVAKMANLAGARVNGAKHEIEVAAILGDDMALYFWLYLMILEEARKIGIDSRLLPDYLDIEGDVGEGPLLIDRLTESEIEASIEPQLRSWREQRPDIDLLSTERMLIGTVRIGQQRFARQMMVNYGSRCAFCGFGFAAVSVKVPRMLIASHIEPWHESTNAQRVDSMNGLAACPTYDAAFDGQLMTVDVRGLIQLGPLLQSAITLDPVLAHNFGPDGLADKLVLGEHGRPPGLEYVQWHYARVMGD